jgi:hypothetical protein
VIEEHTEIDSNQHDFYICDKNIRSYGMVYTVINNNTYNLNSRKHQQNGEGTLYKWISDGKKGYAVY